MATQAILVVALKAAFIRTQVRILSQPLQIVENLTDEEQLTPEAIEAAITEVNRLLKQHSKTVFSTLAIRHVAEQIDKLYRPGEHTLSGSKPINSIRTGHDLTKDATLEFLPDEWPSEMNGRTSDSRVSFLETFSGQSEYGPLLENLRDLSSQRAEAKVRLEKLHQLQSLLEPFRQPEAVQTHLVSKKSELQAELVRTLMLSARVSDRLHTHQPSEHRLHQDTTGRNAIGAPNDFKSHAEVKVAALLNR